MLNVTKLLFKTIFLTWSAKQLTLTALLSADLVFLCISCIRRGGSEMEKVMVIKCTNCFILSKFVRSVLAG